MSSMFYYGNFAKGSVKFYILAVLYVQEGKMPQYPGVNQIVELNDGNTGKVEGIKDGYYKVRVGERGPVRRVTIDEIKSW